MIKDVILNLERNKSRDIVRDYAITVARTFDAHLAGVFAEQTNAPIFFMPEGLPAAVIADILAENKEAARSAIERFEAAVKGSLLSVEHRLVEAPASFSEMARRYDLSVVMQSDNENGVNNDILIEATLFESGRPVIVVPYIQKEGMNLDRIVCCWDGSRAAARAINDALPLLQKARAVELSLMGEKLAAEKALEWGLVNRVHDDAVLMEETMKLAHELANGPTIALTLIRKLYWDSPDNSFEDQLNLEYQSQRIAGAAEDFKEGVTAFLEKRPAKFKGR